MGEKRRAVMIRCLAAVFMAALFIMSSCGRRKLTAAPEEGRYAVYYLDRTATTLESVVYTAQAEDTDGLVRELMEQFMNVPNDADVIRAAGDQTAYLDYRMDGGVLYLYFDERYGEMKTERKTLCNAALTRTMAQVPGVDHVGVYTGDRPLQSDDGAPLGPFAASDFVDSISNINAYETAELTLYFADDSGTMLLPETRTVTYRMDTPIEQLVVEQLIAGPQGAGHKAVISPDTRLLSLSVNENICYLNFSREFLTAIPDEDPYLTIYSLVNSLSELISVQRVQIAVEGSKDILLRDTISLDTLFERNLDYLD